MSHCFSPGVSYTADFESELSQKYGIKSFMADASVNAPPSDDQNFFFVKKFLGSRTAGDFITMSDWMTESLTETTGGLILQMDIEGGEYDVLATESDTTLERFSVMVIEFHSLENMLDHYFLKLLAGIFEKLYKKFSVCHVHPNNCCGTVNLSKIEIPRVIEVTFIRNDLLDNFGTKSQISLPHTLDRRNVEDRPDISMPECWWRR